MVNAVEKFSKPFMELLRVNLSEVLRTVALPEIQAEFLKVYDYLADIEEAEAGSAIKGKDPLSLKNLRNVFASQLNRELARAEIENGQLVIKIMDKSLLGYGGPTPTGPVQTVDILAFYIEGMVEEHAFITPEQYKRGRKGEVRGNFGGRVGGGFMMTRRNYEREGWDKITGVSFAQVRHPISGQTPFNGFDDVPSKINFNKYINMALAQTTDEFGL